MESESDGQMREKVDLSRLSRSFRQEERVTRTDSWKKGRNKGRTSAKGCVNNSFDHVSKIDIWNRETMIKMLKKISTPPLSTCVRA